MSVVGIEAEARPRTGKKDESLHPFGLHTREMPVASILGARPELADERGYRPSVAEGLVEDEISEPLVEDAARDHAHRRKEVLDEQVVVPRVLRLEIGIEPAFAGDRIRQLGGGWCLERRPDVRIQRRPTRGIHGDPE